MEGKRKKGGGGKLVRSETVGVRLDPRLRYLAELAARKSRRTLSSFVEWAVEDALQRIYLCESAEKPRSIIDEAFILWDADESSRFARLALCHPDLLTKDEQVQWKMAEHNICLWLSDDLIDDVEHSVHPEVARKLTRMLKIAAGKKAEN